MRVGGRALRFLHPCPPERLADLPVERRRSSRIAFAATAEIIDEAENTRSTSHVSDLSLHGCFVQLSNPFPEGTPVTIEILQEDEDFVETPATVAFFPAEAGDGIDPCGDGTAVCCDIEEVAGAVEKPVKDALGARRPQNLFLTENMSVCPLTGLRGPNLRAF